MNWARARSRRASGPFSTTKRAPESFAAVSKSISPSASPSSKCCFGWNVNFFGVPTLRSSTLAPASMPDRHIGGRRVGNGGEQVLVFLLDLALVGLALLDFGLEARHLLFQGLCAVALPSRPWPGRSPWRRRCGGPAPPAIAESSRAVPRPGSEFEFKVALGSSKPRSVSPLRKASWLSRIHLMSSTGLVLGRLEGFV